MKSGPNDRPKPIAYWPRRALAEQPMELSRDDNREIPDQNKRVGHRFAPGPATVFLGMLAAFALIAALLVKFT
jgi:hypothetical protein